MSNLGKKPTDDDEVEQLLRAAQDDMLLKLNVNSHLARGSGSAAIDSDLDRRFQALKKPQKPAKGADATNKATAKADTAVKKVHGGAAEEDDDLFARFTALKKSLPSQSKSSVANDVSVNQQVTEEEESEEDEVEKIMKWAIDSARLDPSPPSDDDDDDDDDSSDEEDEDDVVDKKKKKKSKRK